MKIIAIKFRHIFLLYVYGVEQAFTVKMKIEQDMIKLGQSLTISCQDPNGPITGNRKWFGRKQPDLLCLNGVTIDEMKYHEKRLSSSKYQLNIDNVLEEDITYPYACIFGFGSAEIVNIVNESNFINLPTEKLVKKEYVKEKESFSIKVKLQKVFPVPICEVELELQSRNLTKVKEEQNGLLFDVEFSDQSKEPYHACGSPVRIHCYFGKTKEQIVIEHEIDCNRRSSNAEQTPLTVIVPLVVVVLVIVIVVITVLLLKWRSNEPNTSNTRPDEANERYTEMLYEQSCRTCKVDGDRSSLTQPTTVTSPMI